MNVFSAAIVVGNYLLHSEIFLLTAGVMDHWCRRPDSFANLSVGEWKQLAIPVDNNGEYSHCTVREPPDGGLEARIMRCSSWEYDYTQYGNNIVSAWNLVCDRLWLIDFARVVYGAASVIPLVAFASFADSIGRRTVLFSTIPVVLISAVASAMPDDLQFFMIVRAVVSASTSVLAPPAMTLVADVSTINKYPAYVVAVSLLSFILMPITMFAADLARTGWVAVQLILMIPTCLLVVLYYTLMESPIWLLATGNVKGAEGVALRAAHMNNVSAEVLPRPHGASDSRLPGTWLANSGKQRPLQWSSEDPHSLDVLHVDGAVLWVRGVHHNGRRSNRRRCGKPERRPISRCVCRRHTVCHVLRLKKRRGRLGAWLRCDVDRSRWYDVRRRANTERYTGSPDAGSRHRVFHVFFSYESQASPDCDALPCCCRYTRLYPIRGHSEPADSTFNQRPQRLDAAGPFREL
ncbi:hypothetical protein MTO96_004168 [Rhipicephalus appendiculatus]